MLPEFESWLGPYERANAYNSLWLSFLIGKKKKKKKKKTSSGWSSLRASL